MTTATAPPFTMQCHDADSPPPSEVSRDKARTAMSLVTAIAKLNAVQHVYSLEDETGPAHAKVFSVKLSLGSEEYAAEGSSLKKAQQAAAAKALDGTRLRRPASARSLSNSDADLCPVARLHRLVTRLRLGPPPRYCCIQQHAPPRPPFMLPWSAQTQYIAPAPLCPAVFTPSTGFPCTPQPTVPFFAVTLAVDNYEFFGCGPSMYVAKCNCAAQALQMLVSMYPHTRWQRPKRKAGAESKKCKASPAEEKQIDIATIRLSDSSVDSSSEELARRLMNKSPISLLYEVVQHMGLEVAFSVVQQFGLAHQRQHMVRAVVTRKAAPDSEEPAEGDLVAADDGVGSSKQLAKRSACERVLDIMAAKDLVDWPSVAPDQPTGKVRPQQRKRYVIKDLSLDLNYSQHVNPISRLLQVQRCNGEPIPAYELVAETGQARSKEFTIKVAIGDKLATATGPNKKLAKRHAAESMLAILGYVKPRPQPAKSAIKQSAAAAVYDLLEENEQYNEVVQDEEEEECSTSSSSMEGQNEGEGSRRKVRFNPDQVLESSEHDKDTRSNVKRCEKVRHDAMEKLQFIAQLLSLPVVSDTCAVACPSVSVSEPSPNPNKCACSVVTNHGFTAVVRLGSAQVFVSTGASDLQACNAAALKALEFLNSSNNMQ